MKRVVVSFLALIAVALTLPACAGAEGEGEGEGEGEPACTEPTDVPCRDQSFQQLRMSDDLNAREITDTDAGDWHEVYVDSTTGGLNGPDGYIYGKFTDDGFEKVAILDDASYDSMDWDMSFRRYVIRLNSGTGGPSCVTGAALGGTFEAATEPPPEDELLAEAYFIEADGCRFEADGSGLDSAPGTVLQNFWEYSPQNCLQMTGNVYAIQLADGRFVKVEILAYYQSNSGDPLAAQALCNDEGSPGAQGTYAGAHIRFRWSFL